MTEPKDVLEEVPATIEEDITPRDLLKLAKAILLALGTIFLISGLCETYKSGSAFFEACKTIFPSIAGMVIGFYFGKSN